GSVITCPVARSKGARQPVPGSISGADPQPEPFTMKWGARALIFSMAILASTAQAKLPRVDGMSRVTHAHAQQALDCSRRLGRDPGLLIVADMRLPSSAQRLWAIDTRTNEVVLRTEVAHGRGSDP